MSNLEQKPPLRKTPVSSSTGLGNDWSGNKNSIYKTLGASNHTDKDREENDYYATEPKAVELLLGLEDFSNLYVWECACGQGHLSKELIVNGYQVYSSDLIDRGYGMNPIDFLQYDKNWHGDIITNPPYKKIYLNS